LPFFSYRYAVDENEIGSPTGLKYSTLADILEVFVY
jgi:hypothetical protein